MDLGVFLTLLVLGYFFGRHAEHRHYRSIIARERQFRDRVLLIQTRFPPAETGRTRTRLVTGSVVISVDYFKRLLAGLRNLFGGRVKSYESLLDRARREAILRMQEQAAVLGANKIVNVKMETASISQGRRNAIGSVEVLAYGTALIPESGGR